MKKTHEKFKLAKYVDVWSWKCHKNHIYL